LPPHVLLAHVDDTLEAEQGANGRGGHAVLSGAGLGDDPPLAHAPGEQRLTEAVIDFVRARVQQILALEPETRAAERLRQAFGEVEGRWAAGVVPQQVAELGLERRVLARLAVRLLQLFDWSHEDLGDVAPAVRSEVPALVGL
jgi:hypothetical protein